MSWMDRVFRRKFERHRREYEKEKEKVDKALGKPHITLTIELPESCKGMEREFEQLPDDKQFREELEEFIHDYIARKNKERKEKQKCSEDENKEA